MFEEFGIKDNKIFKAVVVATMSSGKSTFINALIGREVLLSRNEACSAQVISILDNDINKNEKVFLKYNNNKIEEYNGIDRDLMEKINQSKNIDKVLFETEIGGIKNTDRAMVIVDTPGVNNSQDSSHKKKTMDLLRQIDSGLIIYLINAAQIGVDDDRDLLMKISEEIRDSKGRKRIIFIVNKTDEIDEQKENLSETINHIHKYLVDAGIVNPQIYPVSSLACKLFRMVMNGNSLTRHESADFEKFYDTFKPVGYNLNRYIISDEYIDKENVICVRGVEYSYADLYMAIDNTGIPSVEHAIEDIIAETGNVFNPLINPRKFSYKIDGSTLEFEIRNGLIFKCPAGNRPISSGVKNGESVARFKRAQCTHCDYAERCGIEIRPKSAIKIIKKGRI